MITTVYSHAGPSNFFVTATDPAGPWSEPVPVTLPAIDPDLAWDAAGNCWVHASNGKQILRCRIDDRTGAVLDGPTPTWSGTGLQYPEAPHLFQRDGLWYLLIAEGGTERGHAVSIARGPSPEGPWESCRATRSSATAAPICRSEHATRTSSRRRTVRGGWCCSAPDPRWLTRLPRDGGETFLAPVEWADG
jgi:beta-xylosidase